MAVVPLFENVIGTINHARARTIRHIVHYMIRLYIYIKDLHQLANKTGPVLSFEMCSCIFNGENENRLITRGLGAVCLICDEEL